MGEGFYETLGSEYDRVIDWVARLDREGPFLKSVFDLYKVKSVMDAACGTGEHAVLFTSWGVEVAAIDASQVMIDACREKYPQSKVKWACCDFRDAPIQTGGSFDAVTCLGNSFPHVLTYKAAVEALTALRRCLRPGGVLVLQMLNYQAMALKHEYFLGPDSSQTEDGEVVFVRCFDVDHAPVLFKMLRLQKSPKGWSISSTHTQHHAWTGVEIDSLLEEVGFIRVGRYADFAKAEFTPHTSSQMIFIAERTDQAVF